MAAEIGNKYAQKFTPEEWEEKFEQVYQQAKQRKYTSLQQAWIDNDIRPTTVKYLVKTHKVLSNIKEDINNAIIMHINDESLKANFNATAGIWRMKQLGEKDKQEVQQTVINTEPLSPEEINKAKDNLEEYY